MRMEVLIRDGLTIMRKTVLMALLLLVCDAQVLLALLHNSRTFKRNASNHNGDYKRAITETGRVFVTMFGYPSKCQNGGNVYPCTLSLACWLSGGSSQSGCGGNPWLVACCVKMKSSQNVLLRNDVQIQEFLDTDFQDEDDFDYASSELLDAQTRDEESLEDCGLSADRMMSKRIIGGKEARFAQFPWQVHIKIGAYQCGGVLVSRRFVATAAHCIIKARLTDIAVYLGELDTQDTGKVLELAPAELHRVKRRIIHPSFKYRITQPDRFDLALLELITEAGLSYHILPICLPKNEIDLSEKFGVVAGWGKIKPSTEPLGTNVLRSATVPILSIQECIKWHETKQILVELYEEMLCAGHHDGHQDACLGDSGGPLITLNDGRWTLIGITSAGFGCGEPYQPGIYHSVALTSNWIRSVIHSHL